MENKFVVETSARHIHLTQETFDFLMDSKPGEHASLVVRKSLSQPGQFVSDTRLNLVGPDKVDKVTGKVKQRAINGVSILGPLRDHNQVEVSATDARTLGVAAPIRESGDVKGSAPIKVVNPLNGKVLELKEGCIVAKRHIHMTPEDAKEFNVKNGDIVKVLISGTGRETVFGDTVIRVSPKFHLDMHIDTDESNAANAGGKEVVYGTLVK
jgi:putative phosphotransacetylase